MKSIVIMASGNGSNAARIISYFDGHPRISVAALISEKESCGALEKAFSMGVKTFSIPYGQMESGALLKHFKSLNPSLIVLAGFIRKIPESVINAYPERIVNVHPSLLPRYGGKGMYGARVHEEVIKAQEIESGITIHFVNEEFDKGRRIAQFYTTIDSGENAQSLQEKIHKLEHAFLPMIIEKTLES